MITNGIDSAEVQEQRREHDQAGAAQEGNCQVQVFVSSNRRVKVKDIRRETERGKVQHERRAATLLEDHEQANAEIDQTDQIEVQIARGPIRNRSQVIEIGIVVTGFRGKGRTFDKVMNLAADPRLLEIDLDVPGRTDLLASQSVGDLFTPPTTWAYSEKVIAGNQPRSGGCGSWLDRLGEDALAGIDPGDAIPRRRLMTQTLRKVQGARGNQQRRRD